MRTTRVHQIRQSECAIPQTRNVNEMVRGFARLLFFRRGFFFNLHVFRDDNTGHSRYFGQQ